MDVEQFYVKQILKVLVYIEDHLEDEMTLQELAKVACYSSFHFHRMFQLVIGEPVHKYIRRLRLEKAANKLCYSNTSITEIAFDSNFDTSSSFTKAFKQCLGKSPKDYRKLNKEIYFMSQKLHELAEIKPEKTHNISEIKVNFIRKIGDYVKSSQDAWDCMYDFIKMNQLDHQKMRYISISHDNPDITAEDKLRFDACIQIENNKSINLPVQTIKGGNYAVFVHTGTHESLGTTFNRIFIKWLPSSKKKFDEYRQCFCEHFNLEHVHTNPDKLVTHVYIPLL